MCRTMRPKSSPAKAGRDSVKHTTSVAIVSRENCLLFLVIAALFFLLVFVFMFAVANDAAFKLCNLVDRNRPHDVDHGQLPGFGHENGYAGNLVAVLEEIDLIPFTGPLIDVGDDARPSRHGKLFADCLDISLAVLVVLIEFKAFYVDTLHVLQ